MLERILGLLKQGISLASQGGVKASILGMDNLSYAAMNISSALPSVALSTKSPFRSAMVAIVAPTLLIGANVVATAQNNMMVQDNGLSNLDQRDNAAGVGLAMHQIQQNRRGF